MRWLDLHRYAPSGQEWFKQIINSCTKDLSEIELALNQQLGFSEDSTQRLHLGVVSSKIYLRLEYIQETDGMQLHNDETFHFHDLDSIDELLSRTKVKLGIKDNISLSRLVHQVTNYDRSVTSLELNTGLHILASYVKGSTLSLLLDSCDMTIQDIQDDIASIGRFEGGFT